VGGFSNRFIELIPESQDEMIARFADEVGAD
jgi:pyruvate-formate lyase